MFDAHSYSKVSKRKKKCRKHYWQIIISYLSNQRKLLGMKEIDTTQWMVNYPNG